MARCFVERPRYLLHLLTHPNRRKTPITLLRHFWYGLVLGADGESCYDCGDRYGRFGMLWWAGGSDSTLWNTVTGFEDGDGLLCPSCFQKRADQKGVLLDWSVKARSF